MKILHITPSYKPAFLYGGPTVSVSNLCEAQSGMGHAVYVYTTTANGNEELNVPTDRIVAVNNVSVFYFSRNTGDHTHVSFSLWLKMWSNVKSFDVIHIHSWWNFLVIGAVFICFIKGIKPILSTRGMLSYYSFSSKNSLKKTVIHFIIGKFLLKRTFLHATTTHEWNICEKIIPSWKGFVGYNIVNIPSSFDLPRVCNPIFRIGILSRLDPVKGIDLLIRSLSKVNFNFHLVLAGDGDPKYVDVLKQLSDNLDLTEKVFFEGWKSDATKFQYLNGLDLLVVASSTENFSNVVVESLSVGTPVLVSDQVGLANLVSVNQWGWVSSLDECILAEKLETAFLSEKFRNRIRENGPGEIRSIFSLEKIVEQYIKAYRELYE